MTDTPVARTLLYTGKGGVGKTSVAAATARRCAREGLRTLVLSTDPAHSLSDVLQVDVGATPTEIGERLWAQEVAPMAELERHWSGVQAWLGELLMSRGIDRISAEELTVPPGADELFSLLELRRHHDAGHFDVIVVDCAPTGETLKLLSFPDVARWWLEKVMPWENQILAAVGPLARGVLDLPLPTRGAIDDVQRLLEGIIDVHAILRDRETASVRLVMTPDRVVVAEAMRTFTYLNLYGFLTDAVVVNRVFPEEVVGTYFGAWRERQQEHLALVEEAFAPLPVLRAPYFEHEVSGPEMLDRLGDALFASRRADAVLHDQLTQELRSTDDAFELVLPLPFAARGDVSLKKVGTELVVRVDGRKRVVSLPAALSSAEPTTASFTDGLLHVVLDRPDRAHPAP